MEYMSQDKQSQWQSMQSQVISIRDGLGLPVDPEIINTVTILRLLGFNTTMSCSGHQDRYTGGPYVLFTSRKAKEYETKRRATQDPMSHLYKHYEHKALQANTLERRKLHTLLDSYYKTHQVPYMQRLIVTSAGLSSSRLQFQTADLYYTLNKPNRIKQLTSNQAEMSAFTKYLELIYFDESYSHKL